MSTAEEQLARLIAAGDDAINREDLDAIMRFYAPDATLVVMPGRHVTGTDAIRRAFVAIAEHFNHTLQVSQRGLMVIEGAGVALVIARTIVRATMKDGTPYDAERKATYVFQRGGDGTWLCVVDNSYGTDLLPEWGDSSAQPPP